VAVTITPGDRGEFTVWVDGSVVASKTDGSFPTEAECLTAVQGAI
jgi:predicted Rdx family selenoprotein